jgi:hypothetical protein
MGLDVQKLEELKQKMQGEEDFAAIWKFFFDHFGENPEFIALGQRADDAKQMFLEPILESLCKQVVKKDVTIAQFILSEIPEKRFCHGPCLTDAGIVVVLYFEDLKMGMFSLTPALGFGLVHYGRFSTLPAPSKHAFFIQSKSKTSH